MNDLSIVFCNTYVLAEGMLMVPSKYDHVEISKRFEGASYKGNFGMDKNFLTFMCEKYTCNTSPFSHLYNEGIFYTFYAPTPKL